MRISRRKAMALSAAAVGATAMSAPPADARPGGLTDAALARTLGDFRSATKVANGVRLHYVTGGRGEPLVLLPGWPQTWWSFHKILPALAARYRVVAVDLRGMGGSDKPAGGYDKKTMAADIRALLGELGISQAFVAGHDIGAMVAHSFAVNHTAATRKVALLDVAHPDPSMLSVPALPATPTAFNTWWFSFNQLRGLPEQVFAGRSRLLIDWMLDNLLINRGAVGEFDRAVYARAYSTAEAIRAGNGWYQSWYQDIEDFKTYGKITVPMLGVTSEINAWLNYVWPEQGTDVRTVTLAGSGHFLAEEQPEALVRELAAFFG